MTLIMRATCCIGGFLDVLAEEGLNVLCGREPEDSQKTRAAKILSCDESTLYTSQFQESSTCQESTHSLEWNASQALSELWEEDESRIEQRGDIIPEAPADLRQGDGDCDFDENSSSYGGYEVFPKRSSERLLVTTDQEPLPPRHHKKKKKKKRDSKKRTSQQRKLSDGDLSAEFDPFLLGEGESQQDDEQQRELDELETARMSPTPPSKRWRVIIGQQEPDQRTCLQ